MSAVQRATSSSCSTLVSSRKSRSGASSRASTSVARKSKAARSIVPAGPAPRAPLAASRSPAAQPAVRACSARAAPASRPSAGEPGLHLVGAEAQVGLVEPGQLAGAGGPGQQAGGGVARRQHQRPLGREALHEAGEEVVRGLVGEVVQVVDDDRAAQQLGGAERVDEVVDRPLAAARVAADRRGEQPLGRDAPGQVERLQGGEQAFEQAVQVVVGVERHPGQALGGRRRRERAHEQGGLAAAGGGGEQHRAVRGQRVAQPRFEQRPGQQRAAARHGRLDLAEREGHAADHRQRPAAGSIPLEVPGAGQRPAQFA